MLRRILPFFLTLSTLLPLQAQLLPLSEAMRTAVEQQPAVKAKQHYAEASEHLLRNARNEYLPNVVAGVQQAYGTVNGQYGPQAPVGMFGVASAGPFADAQSWNAAFGGLYVANVNWEVFTFGRLRARIDAAKAQWAQDSADLDQERFTQRIRTAASYLNLLAAQAFIRNAEADLERAEAVRIRVRARALSGLAAGVDSSIANAEAARVRMLLYDARTNERRVATELAQLLNRGDATFTLDTLYLADLPAQFSSARTPESHPQARFFQARVERGERSNTAIKRSLLPGVTLFGMYQGRGSGFGFGYTPLNGTSWSKSYSDGVEPTRFNYVTGVSLSWNLLSPLRLRHQSMAQQHVTDAFRSEYEAIAIRLRTDDALADERITNSVASAQLAPGRYAAAQDAFVRQQALYTNGLADIVSVQQAMAELSRAGLDRITANINVWQALVLKVATSGDLELLQTQVR